MRWGMRDQGTRPADAAVSTLDSIIADAIQRAREGAIEATLNGLMHQIGDSADVRGILFAEIRRLLTEDPEVKDKLRASVLRMLDAASARRY